MSSYRARPFTRDTDIIKMIFLIAASSLPHRSVEQGEVDRFRHGLVAGVSVLERLLAATGASSRRLLYAPRRRELRPRSLPQPGSPAHGDMDSGDHGWRPPRWQGSMMLFEVATGRWLSSSREGRSRFRR